MTATTIYLFKGSRRPLYRQQNLHLLAAERGTVVELAWNRSWVAPELYEPDTIVAGTHVVVVLTDRPYELFVPVREGTVVEARWDELSLRLWIALGTWVGAPDDDVEKFTNTLRDAHEGTLPGDRFVVRRRADVPLVAWFDEREDEGWRRTIDQVLTLSALSEAQPYAETVFFRVTGLRVGSELHAARHEPLARGQDAELLLGFHNPHLPAERLAALSLQTVAAKDALKVRAPTDVLAHGVTTLALRALADGAELSLRVTPDSARHTQLSIHFAPAGRKSAAPVGQRLPDALRQLYEVVRRNLVVEPARELAVLDAFETVLPGEQRIHERRAVLLATTGSDVVAYDVLRALDRDLLDDDARFLFFRLAAARGEIATAAGLVATLDLAGEERVRARLYGELDRIQPPLLDRLVRELVSRLADDADVHTLLEHVAARLESAELIAETARMLFYKTGDARAAAAFVNERRRALRLAQPEIADVLIELSEAGAGEEDFGDVVAHRIGNLIGRGEVDDALVKLRQATRSLARDERDRLYHRAADQLLERARTDEAVALLIELAYTALATGDILTATDAIERATGIHAARGGEQPAALRVAVARMKAAWEGVEELHEWRTTERERRAALVRERLLNRRVLVVGGLRREGYGERLEEFTGAAVDFAESFRTESDPIGSYAERIRSGRYALVVLRWQIIGHEAGERIKKAAADAGIPFVYARGGGMLGIEEAIVNELRS